MSAPELWSYHNPTRILFGNGSLGELGEHRAGRMLVVTSAGATRRGLTGRVSGLLGGALIEDGVTPNPTIGLIEAITQRHRAEGAESIVAVGGGSAIDVAKVLAVTMAADAAPSVRALLQATGSVDRITPLPVIAVPTTAGTGAEVTPFATVWDEMHGRKHSVAVPPLFPRVAIVDPALTVSLPWIETLSTGLDALSQCLESIINRNAGPISSHFASEGLREIPEALRALRYDPRNLTARTAMSQAALLSGLAISQTRTGLAHSISYPLTGHLGVPHGLACAFSLPALMEFNGERDDGRLAGVADELRLRGPRGLARHLIDLYADLGVWAVLRDYIPQSHVLLDFRDEMFTPGRADTNMIPVSADDIDAIVARSRWLLENS